MTKSEKIKETLEIIDGVREAFKLGKGIRDIVSDGVGAEDLPATFGLIKEQSEKFEVYEAAIKDAKLAKEELGKLEKEDLMVLIFALVDAVSEVEKA